MSEQSSTQGTDLKQMVQVIVNKERSILIITDLLKESLDNTSGARKEKSTNTGNI